jgi:hypothetical protein
MIKQKGASKGHNQQTSGEANENLPRIFFITALFSSVVANPIGRELSLAYFSPLFKCFALDQVKKHTAWHHTLGGQYGGFRQ